MRWIVANATRPGVGTAAGVGGALRPDAQRVRPQLNLDRALEVGPVDPRPDGPEPVEGRGRRVAVVVVGAGRDQREPRSQGFQQRPARRGRAAVMRDLEHVDPTQAVREQPWIDVLLGVAREQEADAVRLAQEHDRDVVDAAPRGRRLGRDAGLRPDHAEGHLVERQACPGGERAPRRIAVTELRVPRLPCRAGTTHPGLEHPADPIALEHPHQARRVILVRVAEDDHVDPPVPRRQAAVKRDQQAVGVRATVDQHASAGPALDEDGIALPDIEHDEPCRPARHVRQADRDDRHQHQATAERDAPGGRTGHDHQRSPGGGRRPDGRGPVSVPAGPRLASSPPRPDQ
jgi:hypothetical protein